MSADALYILYNGKVKGPFTLPQVRHFIKTCQISRDTQIQIGDRTQW